MLFFPTHRIRRSIRMPRQHGIASFNWPITLLRRKGRSGGMECKQSANPTKRPRATGGEPKLGSRNGTKTRKLDDQKVLESENTTAVNHWSDTTGKQKAGKGRARQDRQAQLSERQRRNNSRNSAQNKDVLSQPKFGQEAATSIIHREDTPARTTSWQRRGQRQL